MTLERDFTHPVTSDSNWAKVLAIMPKWLKVFFYFEILFVWLSRSTMDSSTSSNSMILIVIVFIFGIRKDVSMSRPNSWLDVRTKSDSRIASVTEKKLKGKALFVNLLGLILTVTCTCLYFERRIYWDTPWWFYSQYRLFWITDFWAKYCNWA